jgi:hypothetical protein
MNFLFGAGLFATLVHVAYATAMGSRFAGVPLRMGVIWP